MSRPRPNASSSRHAPVRSRLPTAATREIDEEDNPVPGGGRFGVGTRGYMSPQQAQGGPPAISDDVYSLGALLFLLTTGAEPSRAPHPFALLERPVAKLNPGVDQAIAD